MLGPLYFARTPCAGPWNHCYLAAPGTALSTEEMSAFVEAVIRANLDEPVFGENYAGVRRRRLQRGSRRESNEVLVLAGVAMNHMSHTDRLRLALALVKRGTELELLVDQKEWQTYQVRPTPAICEELAEWLRADHRDQLPSTSIGYPCGDARPLTDDSATSATHTRRLVSYAVIALVAVAVAVAIGSYVIFETFDLTIRR